jgi:hypothetical protein
MPSLIQIGDLVVIPSLAVSIGPRTVLSIDGEMVKLDGVADDVPLQQLEFPTVTAELIARWFMSREGDDVPSVIAWMLEDPQERKPQVLTFLSDFMISGAGLARIAHDLSARSILINDTIKAAEEVLGCLISLCKE